VLSGQFEVRRRSVVGEAVIGEVGPGALVGHLALVDGTPCSASIVAKGEATVLEMSRGTFARLFGTTSRAALQFEARLAESCARPLRAALARLAELEGVVLPGLEPVVDSAVDPRRVLRTSDVVDRTALAPEPRKRDAG
jgi:CRP-like cAMP-binding protein